MGGPVGADAGKAVPGPVRGLIMAFPNRELANQSSHGVKIERRLRFRQLRQRVDMAQPDLSW